jgi:hypothetical protein
MSIYDINFSLLGKNLLPPNKRYPIMEAWMTTLLKPLQYLRDSFLDDYAFGANYPYYKSGVLYQIGTKRLFSDNAVYECTSAHLSGPVIDLTKWKKVQNFKAGVFERLNYCDKKIVLEAILNKWFDYYEVLGSPIYIDRQNTPPAGFFVSNREDLCSDVTNKSNKQIYFVTDNDYSLDSSTSFIVYVPLAQFNSLGTTNPEREGIVRSVVDRFNSAGFIYEVTTY